MMFRGIELTEMHMRILRATNPQEADRAQYELDHECCPKCGKDSCISTLMAYQPDPNDPGKFQDLNECRCNCGDVHIRHDRKPKA
jgi:ribosomal protein L32